MEGGVVFCEDCTPWRDRKGNRIGILDLRKMEGLERVAYDDLPDGTHISTVHLMSRHVCYYEDCPSGMDAIYETMHFPSNDCWRYHTLKEAIDGHKEVKKELTDQLEKERLEARRPMLRWKRLGNWMSSMWKT